MLVINAKQHLKKNSFLLWERFLSYNSKPIKVPLAVGALVAYGMSTCQLACTIFLKGQENKGKRKQSFYLSISEMPRAVIAVPNASAQSLR